MTLKVGIDVGGTFTDFVVARDGQAPFIHKLLSTPADPSIAVIEGLAQIAAAQQPPQTLEAFARSIASIVHGTTVTTNATLTGTGARCALLTTEGVRDALEMRRGVREEQYNNRYTNVVPLIPRARRIGVAGRIDRHGDRDNAAGRRRDPHRARAVACRRRAGGRDLLHEFVCEPGARARRRRDRAARNAGRLLLGVE